MTPHLILARPALLFLGIAFLRLDVAAQGYNPGSDPLVERTINHGEQMMGPSYDRRSFLDSEYSRYDEGPVPTLFLPPLPPVVGETMPGKLDPGSSSSNFAVDVGTRGGFAANIDREIFYAAYTCLASIGELPAVESDRIAAYRKANQQLVDEIRSEFTALQGSTPSVRAARLAELSTRQDGPLRARSDEAEAIRVALAGHMRNFDQVRVSVKWSPFAGSSEVREVLFATSFVAGLSTDQRWLLPEIAYEEAGPLLKKKAPEWTSGSSFFFLPATARVQPPADLPPALEAKIRAFVREKESLKRELRDAVLREYFFTSSRTRRLVTLAQRQAPRFAVMEALAEEIRIGLTGLGFPDGILSPTLPADLIQRVGSFYERKVEARRELASRLRTLRESHPLATIGIARQGDGLVIVHSGLSSESESELKKFNAIQASRYAAFAHESELLRREIEQRLAHSPQRSVRTVDQIALDFAKAYAARENREGSRDYIRSVLEPGLSPAQRHALFQSALAEWEQGGESMQRP